MLGRVLFYDLRGAVGRGVIDNNPFKRADLLVNHRANRFLNKRVLVMSWRDNDIVGHDYRSIITRPNGTTSPDYLASGNCQSFAVLVDQSEREMSQIEKALDFERRSPKSLRDFAH